MGKIGMGVADLAPSNQTNLEIQSQYSTNWNYSTIAYEMKFIYPKVAYPQNQLNLAFKFKIFRVNPCKKNNINTPLRSR